MHNYMVNILHTEYKKDYVAIMSTHLLNQTGDIQQFYMASSLLWVQVIVEIKLLVKLFEQAMFEVLT